MNATLDEPQLSAVSSSHSSHDNLDLTNGDMVRTKDTLLAADMTNCCNFQLCLWDQASPVENFL